jgi:hypothetical protein
LEKGLPEKRQNAESRAGFVPNETRRFFCGQERGCGAAENRDGSGSAAPVV